MTSALFAEKQRQRVAFRRASRQSKKFLFGERLSNLDAASRWQSRAALTELYELVRATMIYVTYDQVNTMTMTDRNRP